MPDPGFFERHVIDAPVSNGAPLAEAIPGNECLARRIKGETVYINPYQALYPASDVGIVAPRETSANVVAELGFPRKGRAHDQAVIVKYASLGNAGEDIRYSICGVKTAERQGLVAVGIPIWLPPRATTVIGRTPSGQNPISGRDLYLGIQFDDRVSRNHLALTDTGETLAVHDRSLNGTTFRGFVIPHDQLEQQKAKSRNFVALHTRMAEEHAGKHDMIAADGTFAGRFQIGRDTFPVDGGVDIRSWWAGGEAIVVDSHTGKGKPYYDALRAKMDESLSKARLGPLRSPLEDEVLKAIYDAVAGSMKYDLNWVRTYAKDLPSGDNPHRKVNLSVYLANAKGVCRHMALAAAWLGGDAYQRGLLAGKTTTGVNKSISEPAAHEWARYTSPTGQVYILDPAQHYFGTLENSTQGKRERWYYFRPGEREKYLSDYAAGGLVKKFFKD